MATKQLDKILLDGSTTIQQKIDCLKLLKVVVKNLSDPAKSSDPKYRQLKLDNPKVSTKLMACPAAVPLLVALGFSEEITTEGAPILKYLSPAVDHAAMGAMMTDIAKTLEQLDGPGNNAQNKKPKLVATNQLATSASINTTTKATPATISRKSSTSSTTSTGTEKLSEKQKANKMREAKELRDREIAKAHRKQNVALLKQDKHVRQNDDNWTSGVSAACSKSGNTITTFRDKYGEGEG